MTVRVPKGEDKNISDVGDIAIMQKDTAAPEQAQPQQIILLDHRI